MLKWRKRLRVLQDPRGVDDGSLFEERCVRGADSGARCPIAVRNSVWNRFDLPLTAMIEAGMALVEVDVMSRSAFTNESSPSLGD